MIDEQQEVLVDAPVIENLEPQGTGVYISINGITREMTLEEKAEFEEQRLQAAKEKATPVAIEMRQLRLQLLSDGNLTKVQTAVTKGTVENIKAIQIEWEYSMMVPSTGFLFQYISHRLALDEQGQKDFLISAAKL